MKAKFNKDLKIKLPLKVSLVQLIFKSIMIILNKNCRIREMESKRMEELMSQWPVLVARTWNRAARPATRRIL